VGEPAGTVLEGLESVSSKTRQSLSWQVLYSVFVESQDILCSTYAESTTSKGRVPRLEREVQEVSVGINWKEEFQEEPKQTSPKPTESCGDTVMGRENLKEVHCDGVHIGYMEKRLGYIWYGYDLQGNLVDRSSVRDCVYRTLRSIAYKCGLLVRPRKGVYKKAENTNGNSQS